MNEVEILLLKRNKVFIHANQDGENFEAAMTIAKNFEELGYRCSLQLLKMLENSNIDDLINFYKAIVPVLQKVRGGHKSFNPMYPNFPKQVMEFSDAQLYNNAIKHYYASFISDLVDNTEIVWSPETDEKEKRAKMDECVKKLSKLTMLDVGSEDDFNNIFTQLVASNSSLSESDKEIVKWFCENRQVESLLPGKISQKETIAMLAGWLNMPSYLIKYFKTATDVLRLAVVLSGGDVSLAAPTKFIKFKRNIRKFILNAFEQCSVLTEDMLRRIEQFKRLGEIIHPGEYKERYPKTFEAFQVLRNKTKFETFYSKVEKCLIVGDSTGAADLLSTRPGEFARRLDHVIRLNGKETFEKKEILIDKFLKVAPQVATPLLVQVFNHFHYRQHNALRAFFPKGAVAKVQLSEDGLPQIDHTVNEVIAHHVRKILVKRFSKLPSLGKVYIDPKMFDQNIPFAMRSASKSLRTVARGSKFELPEGSTIRMFLWWMNGEDRTDVDLSAKIMNENFEPVADISYYSLRNESIQGYHSGDITNAPHGACEFIDLNIENTAKKGRYVCMVLNSFTCQPYCDLPECFAGWMMRSKPNSGEVFEARTVQDKIDLSSNTTISMPVILDLHERKMIWMDLALKSHAAFANNTKTNSSNISKMSRAIVNLHRPKLYDLFCMHADARGTEVGDRNEADTVFSINEGITPYHTDLILSEYLA